MTIEQIAMQLWPYWALGVLMILLTYMSEYRKILEVKPKAILKFLGVLAMISIARILLVKYLMPEDVMESTRNMANLIPWQAVLGVFWEDACHSMPLVLLGLMFSKSKWYGWLSKILLLVAMLSFASGHIYQGLLPAAMISFYIPLSMKYGKEHGFGTVMICHILYDLVTILSFRWMLS